MVLRLKIGSFTSELNCLNVLENGYQTAVKRNKNLVIVYLGISYVFFPLSNEEYRISKWREFYKEIYLTQKSTLAWLRQYFI